MSVFLTLVIWTLSSCSIAWSTVTHSERAALWHCQDAVMTFKRNVGSDWEWIRYFTVHSSWTTESLRQNVRKVLGKPNWLTGCQGLYLHWSFCEHKRPLIINLTTSCSPSYSNGVAGWYWTDIAEGVYLDSSLDTENRKIAWELLNLFC